MTSSGITQTDVHRWVRRGLNIRNTNIEGTSKNCFFWGKIKVPEKNYVLLASEIDFTHVDDHFYALRGQYYVP
jgi:hypothetical protein